MPRTCTICAHVERDDLDLAIVSGQSHRAVAAAFRVSHDAVRRHASNHLELRLVDAASRRRMLHDDDLLGRMLSLVREAEEALDLAKSAGDQRALLGALREVRESLKAAAALMPGPADEDVYRLVKALGRVLPRFPEAAEALAVELDALGDAEAAEVLAKAASLHR